MALWITTIIIILTIIIIAMMKMNRCDNKFDYFTKRKISIGVGLVVGILANSKLDETRAESFESVRDLMVAKIRDHKSKLSWEKQLDIEDAISIGLVSYTDIVLLYSYVLDDKGEDLFIFYRHSHRQMAEECLSSEFIPTTVFEK